MLLEDRIIEAAISENLDSFHGGELDAEIRRHETRRRSEENAETHGG
jgi:hypothetical protein